MYHKTDSCTYDKVALSTICGHLWSVLCGANMLLVGDVLGKIKGETNNKRIFLAATSIYPLAV